MPGRVNIFICVYLATLLVPAITEASRIRRQQLNNVSPSTKSENEGTTSKENNMLDTTVDNKDVTDPGKGGSVPLILLNLLPFGYNNNKKNNNTKRRTNCSMILCEKQKPCPSNKICTMTPSQCDTRCLPASSRNLTLTNTTVDKKDVTDPGKGGSVPLIPLNLLPFGYNNNKKNNNTKRRTNCSMILCEKQKPCPSNKFCTMTPSQCDTRCLPASSRNLTLTTHYPREKTTTLRPQKERTCEIMPWLKCLHGVANCSKSFNCVRNCATKFECLCDKGWTGLFCQTPCTLPCVHGSCNVIGDEMMCTCFWQYQGQFCNEIIPDSEEKSRILAAVLSSALAVTVILIIIIPVILWKLRVTFVLKLVYYFKEYEDDDGKNFDAYVSMTPTMSAENFVYGSLRPILENLNFKLYLHARDAPIGEALSETILSALERSRRTIMIVTPDYISSEWNRFEYLIAQHETLKLKQRIIPIILEDIEKERTKMNKSLKHILDSVKCLKFPQVKPETVTLNNVEVTDIQSPDSSRSVDSTTYLFRSGRSVSTLPNSKEQQKYKKMVDKFWNHLTLNMPKKRSKGDQSSGILAKLQNHASYDMSKTGNKCNKQPILNLNIYNVSVNNNRDSYDIKISDLSKDHKNMKADKF